MHPLTASRSPATTLLLPLPHFAAISTINEFRKEMSKVLWALTSAVIVFIVLSEVLFPGECVVSDAIFRYFAPP